jgi:hypothetical protein
MKGKAKFRITTVIVQSKGRKMKCEKKHRITEITFL